MNKLTFPASGGLQLDTDLIDFLQSSLADAINALAINYGDGKYIISGVDIDAGTATDGWAIIDGEVLFFKGAGVLSTCVITETTNEYGETTRQVEFGTGAGQFNFSDFVYTDKISNMAQVVVTAEPEYDDGDSVYGGNGNEWFDIVVPSELLSSNSKLAQIEVNAGGDGFSHIMFRPKGSTQENPAHRITTSGVGTILVSIGTSNTIEAKIVVSGTGATCYAQVLATI